METQNNEIVTIQDNETTSMHDSDSIVTKDEDLIERIATWIDSKGLAVPAVLFLELHKPIAGFGSAFVSFLAPGLDWILGEKRIEDLANILQDRRELERLIARIEDYK